MEELLASTWLSEGEGEVSEDTFLPLPLPLPLPRPLPRPLALPVTAPQGEMASSAGRDSKVQTHTAPSDNTLGADAGAAM